MSRLQKGLTLVEVMVATVVFSMIMVGTTTALSTFASTYQRLHVETKKTTEIREVERFLRETLTDAVRGDGWFIGSKSMLSWVAPIDRVGGAAGLQHLRIAERNGQLILSFAPVGAAGREPAWGQQVPDFPLLQDVQRFALSYQPQPLSAWQSDTRSEAQDPGGNIPWAISLEIRSHDTAWPPLIVHLQQHAEQM